MAYSKAKTADIEKTQDSGTAETVPETVSTTYVPRRKIPLDAQVMVKNLTGGKLIYVSKRLVGYSEEWHEFGEEIPMEMAELYSMKNTDRRFFTENWIEVDMAVLRDLQMDRFYENAITADEIEISDADYAIWYMDCQDNPKKYEGKKVSFLALVYNPDKLKKGIMVPGRFAMTCCVEDVTFIGFKTKYDREDEIPHKSWINITAEVHVEFAKEYKGKGPVLYPISITPAEKPEDELVYFS